MPTSKQDVSMRDLLASCAAASAVSTPPKATGADEDPAPGAGVRDVQDGKAAGEAAPEPAPERRRAA
ncbi:hypothetical protein [Streptomyces gobitricini]|uniref:Uncharacterized protein n=1 Tax=Streptomyces gobitricini TaxID=68211 RepID=A0ABN3MJ67_9ACTN